MFKTPDMKRSSSQKYSRFILVAIAAAACFFPLGAFAAGPPVPSEMSKPMAQVLVIIILALLLMIVMLANVLTGAAQVYMQKYKEAQQFSLTQTETKSITILLFCLVSPALFAADEPAVPTVVIETIGGLSAIAFYTLISVIGIELMILLTLLYNLKRLLAKEAVAALQTSSKPAASFNWSKWWDKLNSFRPVQEEANIDLGHNYDGIRELDNRLPPWWLYGFYLCILFAGIYIYRYHISHSAPLSHEEYQIAMNDAAAEKEEYLKRSANKVDENNIIFLKDAASLDFGKKIFATTCMACHLTDGGGSVGPNLTDAYWLHGGSIKDIFKTIKYGWPEKGMKSWKEDYSPLQIAQLASFVKSLQGTKPAKPKEPQGVLYEEKPAADSAKTVPDKKLTAAKE